MVTLEQIEERLRELPDDKLPAVYEFISRIADDRDDVSAFDAMLAAEDVLKRDWDTPEEDARWAHLYRATLPTKPGI
jgi:hypothetical protein